MPLEGRRRDSGRAQRRRRSVFLPPFLFLLLLLGDQRHHDGGEHPPVRVDAVPPPVPPRGELLDLGPQVAPPRRVPPAPLGGLEQGRDGGARRGPGRGVEARGEGNYDYLRSSTVR